MAAEARATRDFPRPAPQAQRRRRPFHAQGKSLRAIAHERNRRAIRTLRGKPWCAKMVKEQLA